MVCAASTAGVFSAYLRNGCGQTEPRQNPLSYVKRTRHVPTSSRRHGSTPSTSISACRGPTTPTRHGFQERLNLTDHLSERSASLKLRCCIWCASVARQHFATTVRTNLDSLCASRIRFQSNGLTVGSPPLRDYKRARCCSTGSEWLRAILGDEASPALCHLAARRTADIPGPDVIRELNPHSRACRSSKSKILLLEDYDLHTRTR